VPAPLKKLQQATPYLKLPWTFSQAAGTPQSLETQRKLAGSVDRLSCWVTATVTTLSVYESRIWAKAKEQCEGCCAVLLKCEVRPGKVGLCVWPLKLLWNFAWIENWWWQCRTAFSTPGDLQRVTHLSHCWLNQALDGTLDMTCPAYVSSRNASKQVMSRAVLTTLHT